MPCRQRRKCCLKRHIPKRRNMRRSPKANIHENGIWKDRRTTWGNSEKRNWMLSGSNSIQRKPSAREQALISYRWLQNGSFIGSRSSANAGDILSPSQMDTNMVPTCTGNRIPPQRLTTPGRTQAQLCLSFNKQPNTGKPVVWEIKTARSISMS